MIRFLAPLFVFLILTRFIFDPDLGWHLAVGTKFLESGEVVRSDIFSWTMPGYEWGNRYFIYQILVAFLFKNLGYAAATVIFGLIGSFSVLILIPKRLDFVKIAAVFLGVVMSVINLGLRPHMISFLFFCLLLVMLERKFFAAKFQAIFWFGFFALWANFHQGFIVGVLVFAAFLVLDFFWQRLKGKKSKPKLYVGARTLSILAAVSGGFLTPFHGQLWTSLVNDLLGSKTWTFIAEWKSVIFYFPWNLIYAISGLVFSYIVFKKFRESPVWFLLAAFTFVMPFLAVNFTFFWAAFFIYIVSRHLEIGIDLRGYLVKAPIIFASFAAGSALLLGFLLGVSESLDLQNRLMRDGYPVSAVRFLSENGYDVRIFNSYAWGGYIDFFAPEIRVFIDGRMTGWRGENGGYILADYFEILNGNCELALQYDIKTVLMEKDYENKCFSEFREVYRDSVAKILIKG